MRIDDLKAKAFLLLECISGSKAYGLNTPTSDTDIKGVFALAKPKFYGLTTVDQVSNHSNDEVYYELKRFVELLVKNNPNILELLNTPEDCVLFKHPLMSLLTPELFLSKLCRDTFAGYAKAQIKKAKGLNKKIVNPVEKQRKSILDFCYVFEGHQSVKLSIWLAQYGFLQEDCGIININHMREVYALYHNSQLPSGYLRGLCSGLEANSVLLSSIPKSIQPLAILSFNKDGYSMYCKDYREYWERVENRNNVRYAQTMEHGKHYDAKNMMHTFRLLNMAEEIAKEGRILVKRPDRAFLLSIRSGGYSYEKLVDMANEKTEQIDVLYKQSRLPKSPDIAKAEAILCEIREALYTK